MSFEVALEDCFGAWLSHIEDYWVSGTLSFRFHCQVANVLSHFVMKMSRLSRLYMYDVNHKITEATFQGSCNYYTLCSTKVVIITHYVRSDMLRLWVWFVRFFLPRWGRFATYAGSALGDMRISSTSIGSWRVTVNVQLSPLLCLSWQGCK